MTLRERATGIEPAFSAWEADVLPLNYAREPSKGSRVPKPEALPAHDSELEPALVKRRPSTLHQRVQRATERVMAGLTPA